MGLAELDRERLICTPTGGPRTTLDRSSANRAYAARLARADGYLSGAAHSTRGPGTRGRGPLGSSLGL